ncbi:hypothetical protein HNR07_004161 [Nocardiopsis metallicus]|uniref:Uncharacterized protein n=1 Tax=Nocardiopsis metallicus TaxID=179819 RepID=A0A840WA63_9ACTN|nr:hypothetical protein [Nocardiopsis metallicus]
MRPCVTGAPAGVSRTLLPGPEAVVTTVTRAVPRPALRTSSLITSVVLLVILSFPVAAGLSGERDTVALPSHGGVTVPADASAHSGSAAHDGAAANSSDDGRDTAAHEATEEARPYLGSQTVALGPPASTCDQRSVLRDLPDAVPTCALRLAVWDQPWWPLHLPHHDPVPERADAEGLPPTRAPPLTAHTIV